MVGGVRCLHRTKIKIIGAVATSYLLGVSTRRMEKLVEQLGITRLSKSQVSEMARDLDAQVEAFRTRPLNAGPYTFDQCEGVCWDKFHRPRRFGRWIARPRTARLVDLRGRLSRGSPRRLGFVSLAAGLVAGACNPADWVVQ